MLSILTCSVDSFFAAFGLGLSRSMEMYRGRLVLAFAACDLIATLLGTAAHSYFGQIPGRGAGPEIVLAFLTTAAVALAVFLGCKRQALVFAIPFVLSLDNFLAGLMGASVHAAESPLLAGLASGLFAAAGLGSAHFAVPLLSRRNAILVGLSTTSLTLLFAN